MNESLTIDPSTQFQIGDVVIYVPEGIVAQVSGFHWSKAKPPRIARYHLTCGLCIEGIHIRRYANELDASRRRSQ